ncbi:MAG: aminomethyl-transferring glycine dehydrogenase subunit GcvPB, partial [Bacteroidaceae bacterium]
MNNTYYNKLVFELSKAGRQGYSLPTNEFKGYSIPDDIKRNDQPMLPEADEQTIVRHYTNMSNNNFGVDSGFYPLGSCTMKYNPKINEENADHPAFRQLHPLSPASAVQGALEVYYNTQKMLSEIGGMSEFTLNPFAGAHGELTGLMVIRNYHIQRGDLKRTKIIIPDSAHGTNPASAAVCGLEVVEVKSNA